MLPPTKEQVNEYRKSGFQPDVVGCFVYNKKILFLYKEEHKLWQFPQARIKRGETAAEALWRGLVTEIGEEFLSECEQKVKIFMEEKISFPPTRSDLEDLTTDQGEKVETTGKAFYLYAVQSGSDQLDIGATDFDDFAWKSFVESIELTNTIYQPGKQRITVKAVTELKKLGRIE